MKKIQHIIATQQGEPDEMCPDSLEETLYWCVIKCKNTEHESMKSPRSTLASHTLRV